MSYTAALVHVSIIAFAVVGCYKLGVFLGNLRRWEKYPPPASPRRRR